MVNYEIAGEGVSVYSPKHLAGKTANKIHNSLLRNEI